MQDILGHADEKNFTDLCGCNKRIEESWAYTSMLKNTGRIKQQTYDRFTTTYKEI